MSNTFSEVFEFLVSDRKDVAKMAAEGLAAHSMNNADLAKCVVATPRYMQVLLERLSTSHLPLLGNILTILINLATNPSAAEQMSKMNCINRVIRLFDGLERVQGDAPVLALQELSLMLLNNLTSTHLRCVADLLQLDDEDLKGFNFGLFKAQYDRQPETVEGATRSLRPWFMKICLNITRSGEGQEMLVNDEEWFECFVSLLGDDATPTELRTLAFQICHHCTAQKQLIPLVCEKKLPHSLLRRLSVPEETSVSLLITMLETVEMIMGEESGMQVLEELNAKSVLAAAAEKSEKEVRQFIRSSILPYLDDVQDVYVMNDNAD